MAIITLFSAAYSHGEEVAELLVKRLGWRRVDGVLLDVTARQLGVDHSRLIQAMEGPPFAFNKLTHRRELYLAHLKVTLSELVEDDDLILHGFATHLVPREMARVLRACLLADPEHRALQLQRTSGLSAREASRRVRAEDQKRAQWTRLVAGLGPWDRALYDLRVAVNETGVEQAAELIVKHATRLAPATTAETDQEVRDFQLASRVGLRLAEAGHLHHVAARLGEVTVTIDEYVLRLERLEAELEGIVRGVPGVEEVRVKTGPNYRPASLFASVEFELPQKVLLVDDEQDFVLTLSERLEMRDLEPAIAYSGEEALTLLGEEEPDVMILDLKMPGIDGIEVLRRVKAEHPEVEVIILTGHGSEKDKEMCLQLGAFAYLEKPVDINVLADAMSRAKDESRQGSDRGATLAAPR